MSQNENAGDRELLVLATTALRDLYVGYPHKEIAASGGQGLEKLLRELVSHLRSHGVNDEGGWDCDVTDDIPVAQ
jgi:hypothetical protein